MDQKKETIIQGTPSYYKRGIHEARHRSARMQKEKILSEKVEAFTSELKAEGVRYFIFTEINANCHIKVDCTNEKLIYMLTELCSRMQNPLASFIGEQMIAHGLTLLQLHNKDAFDIVKKNIAEL